MNYAQIPRARALHQSPVYNDYALKRSLINELQNYIYQNMQSS